MRSFRELQELHKMWKEELGPVAREHREGIWERFKVATKIINDKRQVYYKEIDKVYEKNLENKLEIIANIDVINAQESSSHSSWQKRIKEIGANRRRGRALKGFHKKRELDDEKHQNTRSVKLNVFMISQYDTTKRHLLPCENPFKGRTTYIVYDISPFVSKKQKKIS